MPHSSVRLCNVMIVAEESPVFKKDLTESLGSDAAGLQPILTGKIQFGVMLLQIEQTTA